MKVCLYARVSTDDHDQDPERQLLKCRQYADLHGHFVLAEAQEFFTGESDPHSRPEFQRLLALKPEGIVVFSIDRLSRQHPSKVMSLLTAFKDAGLKIISITEPIFNMESEFADLLQYILAWWNNYFLKKLKRDIKSGMDRARAQGKQIGRPGAEFNKYRAYQLLMVEKKSLRAVAAELGTSPPTLMRFKREMLKDPKQYINGTFVSKPDGSETDSDLPG